MSTMASKGRAATGHLIAGGSLVAFGLASCAPSNGPRVESATIARPDAPTPSLRGEVEGFVPRRSSRLHLTVPLPDGGAWYVDDRSTPDFLAEHAPTQSRLLVRVSVEREVMNRARCEERARAQGLVPTTALKTVESAAIVGPSELDTQVLVAIEPGKTDAAPVVGYVFAFGAQMRKCVTVRYETRVPSSRDGEELSARLALVRTRVIPEIQIEPVLDAMPRETPQLPRRRGDRNP